MNSLQFTKEELVPLCKICRVVEGKPHVDKYPLLKTFESLSFHIPLFETVLSTRSKYDVGLFGYKPDNHIYARFLDALIVPFNEIPMYLNRYQGLYKDVLMYRLETLGK